jgi:D-3-phosphoglycerate dehydrogenase
MIINCARGGIVSEMALHAAIVADKVAGAALDVFENEPPEDSPLLKPESYLSRYGYPHSGICT